MAVDAVLSLDDLLPLNMIGIKQVQGGALEVRTWSGGGGGGGERVLYGRLGTGECSEGGCQDGKVQNCSRRPMITS